MKVYDILVLLLFVCLLCVGVVPVTAIHEDEQGLRDWIRRFVGHVEHATFHPGLKLNHVYVTTAQGAVAALSLSDGDLQWRKLLSEPQVCVAANKQEIVVSSRTGTVHVFDAATGNLASTFKLMLPNGASVGACATAGKVMKVAAVDTSKAYLYEFDSATDEEEIKPRIEFSIGVGAREIRISGNHLWVLRQTTADRYSLEGNVEVTGVEGGSGAAVTGNGEAVIFTSAKVTVVRNPPKVEEAINCNKCGVGVLVNTAGAFGGQVTTQTEQDGFSVVFPTSTVRVPYLHGDNGTAAAAPVVLLAVQDAEHGACALVRAANGHLLAVAERTGTMWERMEGLAQLTAMVIADNPLHEDHFSFNKLALVVSTYGVVYAVPIADMGLNIRVLADISGVIMQKTAAASMASVKIERVLLSGANTITVVASSGNSHVTLSVDTATGAVKDTKTYTNALFVAPAFTVKRSLEVEGSAPSSQQHVFAMNMSSGRIEGYVVSTSSSATPLWTVRMPYPLVAYATGVDALRTTVINHLRVFPNKSTSTDEVRRKYPTRNVLVVAHYEPSEEELTTLVITTIDTITGSVLGSVRHRNVEGNVHLLIVEHAVLYHFMDAEKMRHCLGVWEMFEEESGPVLRKDAGATLPQVIASFFFRSKKVFSSRATRPPAVTAAVLGINGGEVATMSVTASFNGIARKSVVLAFESGRVATVELNRLLAGGQPPLDDKGNQLTHVLIPSTALATHKYRVAKPSLITTGPTNLESSCHVLVSGLDLFYVRASSGKAFDLLNSDFNKDLLIMLTCGLGVLAVVARYFVMRKGLNLLWR
ncbi:hypothetical protein DQ04_00071160 [Trypanosoma grayi]|uniref:hypothetical protein n=1 Tax=Trypanosoma grayi TaxID=71804 RepID=UPI0004F4A479|nr:hypothetical protein DQ04_00071160 [Trypanosoma grayi]KEG15448.1 hypothetical protein DQ04_00071160 [Trypanosoma grayi]